MIVPEFFNGIPIVSGQVIRTAHPQQPISVLDDLLIKIIGKPVKLIEPFKEDNVGLRMRKVSQPHTENENNEYVNGYFQKPDDMLLLM